MTKHTFLVLVLAACDLGPRVDDAPDAPRPPDAAPDAPSGFAHLLPAGTEVPSVSTNAELILQIRINDGLSDMATTIPRGTGKSGGTTVRFWNFGPVALEGTLNIAVIAPLYVFGRVDGAGVFTPLADHPRLIDTVPGDVRYSAIRRVLNVPVTDKYQGELITSVAALGEALELGLVTDPVPDGTWVNLPVVLPNVKLEVAAAPAAPLDAQQVYGKGYKVDVFELGTSLGRQPFRFGFVTVGQASFLQSGVATGTPPVLPTAVDAQPVFQFTIPTAPPGMTLNYTPIATRLTVRLANGVAPTAITSDFDMFRRSAAGAINGIVTDTVASFVVESTTQNLQLQFVEGSP